VPFVYMVLCSDGSLYTGWAMDVEARVREHNAGRGSQYCKQRRPVRVVYREEVPNRSAAMKREMAIKRMRRDRKLRLVEAFRRQEVPS
jgi:predicted GIY-YIG superfamily endonuclease